MMRNDRMLLLGSFLLLTACGALPGGPGPGPGPGGNPDLSTGGGNPDLSSGGGNPDLAGVTGCPLAVNTTPTTVQNTAGCFVLNRDASACQAARTAQGLSGYWLKFSCRV